MPPVAEPHPDRAERRRRYRAAERGGPAFVDPEKTHGVIAGWAANDSDLEECKRRTHDSLIDLMGDRRAGPVMWQHGEGREAQEMLRTLWTPDVSPDHHSYYRRLAGLLRENGGYLVVAFALQRDP